MGDAERIERVSYTASLVTQVSDIDAQLDTLREITARFDPNQSLTAEDRASLEALQQWLENYLVTAEKIRLFTPESLQLQIEQHLKGDTGAKSRRELHTIIIVAACMSIALGVLLPLANVPQRVQVGGSVLFSLVNVGAAWLFLTALPAFQSELRNAFRLICIGVSLIGLSLLTHPIVEIFGLRQLDAARILLPLPLLIAAIIFHIGNLKYAQLVGLKGKLTTLVPATIMAAGMVVLTIVLPHRPLANSEFIFDFSTALWGVMLVTPIASILILPAVVRKLPELYKPSARALSQSMWAITAVIGYQYVALFVAPVPSPQVQYVLFGLVVVMGIMLLRAGYKFHKVSRY